MSGLCSISGQPCTIYAILTYIASYKQYRNVSFHSKHPSKRTHKPVSHKNSYGFKPQVDGVPLKKQLGQHFLRDEHILDRIAHAAPLKGASVFEIGCGDGALTRMLLQQPLSRLWVFEIDEDWARYVSDMYGVDKRLRMIHTNILNYSFADSDFTHHAPWVLVANLPYNVTFPILHALRDARSYIREGVIMVQEEVADRITSSGGRSMGWLTLYFQHAFSWKRLEAIQPGAFYPPPKVVSRVLHFTTRMDAPVIPDEQAFWKFVKACFSKPRRMLRNNLPQLPYNWKLVDEETLNARAQQLEMHDFLRVWDILRTAPRA